MPFMCVTLNLQAMRLSDGEAAVAAGLQRCVTALPLSMCRALLCMQFNQDLTRKLFNRNGRRASTYSSHMTTLRAQN